MQELVILLSSIAGAASAIAVKKFPKNSTKLQSIGTSSYIKNQINSLKIEKDILNKTIARLYEDNSNLSKIQKDKLLLKYQHQLGIILAKLEKLEIAKRHPDLGPVGDGLITLMDQKLSQLDNRLYELSSKITIANTSTTTAIDTAATIQTKENKESTTSKVEKSNPIKRMRETFKFDNKQPTQVIPAIEIPKARKSHMEITTLTSIPRDIPKYPFEEKINDDKSQKIEDETKPNNTVIKEEEENILQNNDQTTSSEIKIPDLKSELPKSPTIQTTLPKPAEIKEIPKTTLDNEDDNEGDDDDDLEKLKGQILKTLTKLEQAEGRIIVI